MVSRPVLSDLFVHVVASSHMPASGSTRLWWLLLAVGCQFVWGIYPAAVRYLQTQGASPLTSLQLSLLINLLACPALLLGTTLPTWLHRKCGGGAPSHGGGSGSANDDRSAAGAPTAAAEDALASARAAAGSGAVAQAAAPTPILGQGKRAGWRSVALDDSALREALLPPEGEEEVEEWLELQLGKQLHGLEAGWGSAFSPPHPDLPPTPGRASSRLTPPRKHPYATSTSSEASGADEQQQQQQQQLHQLMQQQRMQLQQQQHKLGLQVPPHLQPLPLKTTTFGARAQTSASTHALAGGERRAGQGQGASWGHLCLVLLATTFFLTLLFLSQVFSLLFTTAYLSQMVFLLAPVIVALLARALFKQPLPPGLWTALLLMLLGCGMVIGSKAQAAGQQPAPSADPGSKGATLAAHRDHLGTTTAQEATWQPSHLVSSVEKDDSKAVATGLPSLWARNGQEEAWLCSAVLGPPASSWLRRLCGPGSGPGSGGMLGSGAGLGPRDAIGIGLALLGATSLAGFMLVVQRCGRVVSNQQVLWANFLAQSALCACLLARFDPAGLPRLLSLAPRQLAAVAALATGVNWGANMAQQMCIKALGAPQAAAFLPVRLLGSLAASYPLLSEGLAGPWQWGGCALLLAAVSWYLLQQRKSAEHCVADAAVSFDTAGPAQTSRLGGPAAPEPYLLVAAEAHAEGMVGA